MYRIVLISYLLLSTVSCSNSRRSVQPPRIDSEQASASAMAQYDANGDGKLDQAELTKSALTLELWDTNSDGGVAKSEIAQRLGKFIDTGVGLVGVTCFVSWNRSPLAEAEVVFEPEAFLGEEVKGASGTTGVDGGVAMSVAEDFLPQPNMKGIQPGLYRVRITHPQIALPEIYNTNTTLTYEYSPIDSLPMPRFNLTKQ